MNEMHGSDELFGPLIFRVDFDGIYEIKSCILHAFTLALYFNQTYVIQHVAI